MSVCLLNWSSRFVVIVTHRNNYCDGNWSWAIASCVFAVFTYVFFLGMFSSQNKETHTVHIVTINYIKPQNDDDNADDGDDGPA